MAVIDLDINSYPASKARLAKSTYPAKDILLPEINVYANSMSWTSLFIPEPVTCRE